MTNYYTLAMQTLPDELANAVVFLAGREDYEGLLRYLQDAFRNHEYLAYSTRINAVWRAVLADGVQRREISQEWADRKWWAYPDVDFL